MTIGEVVDALESYAPLSLQENYDNAGLLTGDRLWNCSGVLCALDSIEQTLEEAIQKNCNLIVAHHPIIFKGLKKINGSNYIERTIIKAIKHDIALYAIHTNLDNILDGVNGKIADRIGLIDRKLLLAKQSSLKKLYCFVPTSGIEKLRNALFEVGAGKIGLYSECSFSAEGVGTFKPETGANPVIGSVGKRQNEPEQRLELVFPATIETKLVKKMLEVHPYDEVAYDIITVDNQHLETGSGILGKLPQPMEENTFLHRLKEVFGLSVIRHTAKLNRSIETVAICGGAGSFLINNALASKADAYVTADIKYHEFFDADGKTLLCDIGHFETEQFTIDLIAEILRQKFPTFAILKSDKHTNPVYYYF